MKYNVVGQSKVKDDERIYPCANCGKLRSKNEGGTTFTLCDECWDIHFAKENKPKYPVGEGC